MKIQNQSPNLIGFSEWVKRFKLSRGFARKLMFFRFSNGLNTAVIKLGTRLYVDVARFNEWLEQYRELPYGSLRPGSTPSRVAPKSRAARHRTKSTKK